MKKQLPDLINSKIIDIIKSYKRLFFMSLVAFLFFSGCKNDLEKIQLFSEEAIIPNLSGKNVTILRSDSARLGVRIVAPEIRRYDNLEEPFMEFPKGVEVFFLDSLQEVKTYITAKYAIRYEQQFIYYARDSVVAKNVKTNEWVKSEEMYWDEKNGLVYSEKFTTIQRKDGIYYGRKGFESTQDFTSWKLKKPTAKLTISDDNENEEGKDQQ